MYEQVGIFTIYIEDEPRTKIESNEISHNKSLFCLPVIVKFGLEFHCFNSDSMFKKELLYKNAIFHLNSICMQSMNSIYSFICEVAVTAYI